MKTTPQVLRLLIFLAALSVALGFALGRLLDTMRGYLP